MAHHQDLIDVQKVARGLETHVTKDFFIILKSLIIFISLLRLFSSEAYECKTYDVDRFSYIKEECKNGQLLYKYNYSKKSNHLYSKTTYKNQKKIEIENYSNDGDFYYRKFNYLPKSFIETRYIKNSKTQIKSKTEKSLPSKNIISTWTYENGKPTLKDTFVNNANKVLKSRYIFKTANTYHLNLDLTSKYKDVISSFTVKDQNFKIIGHYSSKEELSVTDIIKSQKLSQNEKDKRLEIYHNTERIPFAVIDSGFDINHTLISHKLYNSSHYLNTAHGLRYLKESEEISLNIKERLIIGSLKPMPLSHGTHVASIALKGLDTIGLVGFAGDVSSPKYLELLSKRLNLRKIKFANMSWGFKEQGFPMTPQSPTYNSLKKLISSSQSTLFVVAAGNSSFNLDSNQYDYPASYQFNNILVIGALNTSNYNWKNDKNVTPATFKTGGSNIGDKSVDIFAPGKKVNGAKLAGGKIRLSGTSMASPMALNTILAFESIYPKLTPLKIKEILLKSASYFKKDLPCLSRGVINHKRMIMIAKLLKTSHDQENLEAIILQSKKMRSLDLPAEIQKSVKDQKRIWLSIDKNLSINKP